MKHLKYIILIVLSFIGATWSIRNGWNEVVVQLFDVPLLTYTDAFKVVITTAWIGVVFNLPTIKI